MNTNDYYKCDECLEPVENEFSMLCDSCSAEESDLWTDKDWEEVTQCQQKK